MTENTEKKYKVVILHNFDYQEITAIMNAVRKVQEGERNELIFAKSTEKSLKMKLGELIEDMTEDHEYLMQNPPDLNKKGD